MIAIVDANIFIKKTLTLSQYTKLVTTPMIINELKDNHTVTYLSIIAFNLDIQEPLPSFVKTVAILNHEKNLLLSNADVELVALALQLSQNKFNTWLTRELNITCLSDDNGVKHALKMLGFGVDIKEKVWKFRCYACSKIYEKQVDFCRACGYNTITRVSVREENGKEVINVKKGYVIKHKEIKDKNGVIIKSEDQKEYTRMKKEQFKSQKKLQNSLKHIF
ncbi:hypothetical protein COBT_001298 [Conglomerata obtusa]